MPRFPRVLLAAVLLVATRRPAVCQSPPSLPAWLVSYPGATPDSRAMGGLLESTYTTSAKPAQVVEHYRGLFEAAGLRFQPNADGIGSVIRADAAECDLLILIRERAPGTFVDVNCAAKSQASVRVFRQVGGDHRRRTLEGPASPNRAPARSLPPKRCSRATPEGSPNWASIPPTTMRPRRPWSGHPGSFISRARRCGPQQGIDDSRNTYLKVRYISSLPMTTIYNFYEDLLNSNEYRVHTSRLSTGQTISGVVQNAWGYVEGTNYPDGAPGPRTVIHVSFSRSKLNDPITVEMRFTVYEFVAPKGRPF